MHPVLEPLETHLEHLELHNASLLRALRQVVALFELQLSDTDGTRVTPTHWREAMENAQAAVDGQALPHAVLMAVHTDPKQYTQTWPPPAPE